MEYANTYYASPLTGGVFMKGFMAPKGKLDPAYQGCCSVTTYSISEEGITALLPSLSLPSNRVKFYQIM
jgi:hypothetical protein